MRLPVERALPLVALILLAGCGASGGSTAALPPSTTGPAADYPMVLGESFVVDGTTYKPEDKLSYDAVGYAAVGETGGAAISGAHKTLPLPSYVEVTSLDSGKTILLRLERRGPMVNDTLIELSPGAAAQLGFGGDARTPVRVRRVNPPEVERAMLRSGGRVPERMATPAGLLTVLKRKLQPPSVVTPALPAAVAVASPSPEPAAIAPESSVPKPTPPAPAPAPAPEPKPTPAPAPKPTPTPAPKPAALPSSKPEASGSWVVQVATFSTEERAKAAASRLSGRVTKAGRFWQLSLGRFTSRADAQAALAKARSAGYSDARIQRGG